MGPQTLLLDAGIVLATAALYAYVGVVTWRRRVGGEAQLASDLFATWWFALAATTAAGVLTRLMGWAGVKDLALYLTVSQVTLFGLCVALWGLLYYLLYLFSGRRQLIVPVSLFYVGFYAWLVYLTVARRPIGVTVDEWKVSLTYASQYSSAVLATFVLLLILPPLLGAAAYARLFFRVRDRTQRYRIGLVSSTIVAWFGTTLVVWFLDASQSFAWQVTSRLIGLGAAYLIYAAYRPPGWVRARWGIRRVDEPEGTT